MYLSGSLVLVGSYLVCWWLVIFGMLVALVCDLHVPEL